MLISAFRIAYTGDVLTALAPFVMCLSNDEELWLAPTRLHLSLLQSSPFDNVQDMTLSCLFLPAFTFETFHWCFDGSLQRLRDLKLDRPISCPQALVSFIASFPNLQNTVISAPSWMRESSVVGRSRGLRQLGQRLPHDRRLRGALYLKGLERDSGRFFSHLATGVAGFEKVAFLRCTFGDPRPFQRFISSIGAYLRILHVMLGVDRELPSVA